MGAYQHVVVVMSIVLGLAVTQLLRGIAQLYRTRKRVRTYWLHWAWIVLLVVFSLLLWWTFWNYRSIQDWDFFRFVAYLSPTIVFYFLTAVAIPDPSDAVSDLKEYYFANRVGFFGTFALYGVVAGFTAIFVRGLPLVDRSNILRLVMVLLMLLALRSTSERVHTAVLILSAILMFGFILFFQPRLG
ncbi:MAG: hypothetical protein ACREMI_11875 [Gemmatimonadales bacterium]